MIPTCRYCYYVIPIFNITLSAFIVTNSNDKAAVFKASRIPLKTTRTTQGVQLLVSKKGSVLTSLSRLAEVNVKDPEYYRIIKVPAIGYYIKENTLEAKQVSFDDLK